MVSGSHSSPSRGSSHLSVTLLSSLSVIREYLALRDGPRGFSRGFTCPDLLRYPPGGSDTFAYGAVTLYGRLFQAVLLACYLLTPIWKALQPRRGKPPRFGLFPVRSPLLRESIFFLFHRLLRCFSSPGLPPHAYGFSVGIFGNPGINARLSTPPGLSQTSTPFIAF